MHNRNKTNVLLVEILIVILFFMLSATVLVQVFATAKNMATQAAVETRALAEAQNTTEAMYASSGIEETLSELGFSSSHGTWTKNFGDYSLFVGLNNAKTEAGTFITGNVDAFYIQKAGTGSSQNGKALFSLPFARYQGDANE